MRYKVLYYSAIPQARQDNLFIVRRRQGQIFDTLMMKAWMYKTLILAAFNNTYSLGDFNLPVVAECARARGGPSMRRKKDGCFGPLSSDSLLRRRDYLSAWRVCIEETEGDKKRDQRGTRTNPSPELSRDKTEKLN